MAHDPEQDELEGNVWWEFLTTGRSARERRFRRWFARLPAKRRCLACHAPFDGVSAPLVRTIFDKRPSNMNPNVCTICEYYAVRHQGGAELELSLLFADVRGSTRLAESMTPTEFSRLINRFYTAATDVLVKNDAMIDKLAGDQVAGIFVPGLAGPEHPRKAITAAQMILRATGHGEPGGPWAPIGAGVHTGTAFVGAVGSSEGTTDITVLGDAANTAARLSSNARQGEILISEAACAAVGSGHPALDNLEVRHLELKGKSDLVSVRVLTNYEVG